MEKTINKNLNVDDGCREGGDDDLARKTDNERNNDLAVDLRAQNACIDIIDEENKKEVKSDDLACALDTKERRDLTLVVGDGKDPAPLRYSLDHSEFGSTTSVITTESMEYEEDRLWQKRKRPSSTAGTASQSASDSPDELCQAKTGRPKSKRGRGRPPITGQYVGLTRAKAAYAAAQQELELQMELERAELTRRVTRTRSRQISGPSSEGSTIVDGSEVAAVQLGQVIDESVATVLEVTKKSKNSKAIKEAVAKIKGATSALLERSISEETRKLQAANSRLQSELEELRKEFSEFKAGLTAAGETSLPKPATNEEDLERSIMLRVGTMVNARLEALELSGRLLPEKRSRPPLAGEKTSGSDSGASNSSAPLLNRVMDKEKSGNVIPNEEVPPPKHGKNKKQKKKKKEVGKGPIAAQPETSTERQLPNHVSNEGWTLVQNKKKKKAEKATAPKKDKARKLRVPASSAVVITLQAGAEERGISYASILSAAKSKVDLAALGIPSLRFRKAVTGARILEIPGATSGTKADSLAEKLRESLDADSVKISRPIKCSEMRIHGLDDSVTADDVVAAVASTGDCSVESVKCNGLRCNFRGVGTAWVSCPVTAAKKITQNGHLLVGWVKARVRLVEPKAFRCYRCLELGHVRAQCKVDIDRSDLCYRCGQTGHKAADCSASTLCCAICIAARKPAEHRLGSPTCLASTLSKRGGKKGQKASYTMPPARASPMET